MYVRQKRGIILFWKQPTVTKKAVELQQEGFFANNLECGYRLIGSLRRETPSASWCTRVNFASLRPPRNNIGKFRESQNPLEKIFPLCKEELLAALSFMQGREVPATGFTR